MFLAYSIYLYISVGEKQVHYNVLSQNLSVVDAEFDPGKLLSQLLTLVFISSFSDVVQESVFVRSTVREEFIKGFRTH